MGKVKYYDYEIEDRLRQVDINRNDIGMTQINVLPIPDGAFDLVTDEVPVTMELDVTGALADGSIIVDVDGEADASSTTISAYSDFAMLTVLGTETASTGIVKPGKYLMSLGGSDSAADMPWQEYYPPKIRVTVTDQNLNAESYSVDYGANAVEIIIPENFTTVEFRLNLWFDSFVGAHSCELYPFLRLKALADEPFEPYKPDLQTQITSYSARTADALGTDGSINLFPIDKGEWGNPVISDANIGFFAVMQANSGHGLPSVVAFTGESNFTTAESAEYKTFINCGYRFGDDKRLWGDLVPGDYTLSFDIFGDSSFFDVGKFCFEIYAKASMPDVDYGDLIATCTGTAVDFTVTAEKPFILIVAVAERLEGHNWSGAEIYAVPFLRRKIFATAARDEYQPPIKKQLAEIRYQISALRSLIVNNVIQTDKITDTSEEGPLT